MADLKRLPDYPGGSIQGHEYHPVEIVAPHAFAQLLTDEKALDGSRQGKYRGLLKFSRNVLQDLKGAFLSMFGAHGVDQADWWRSSEWATRQRLVPGTRLRGEMPRLRRETPGQNISS